MWVCFGAFYPVPLIYVSIFVSVPYCFDDCSFEIQSEAREPDSSNSIFLFQDSLAIQGLLCFHTHFKIFCSSSMVNIISNLIGIENFFLNFYLSMLNQPSPFVLLSDQTSIFHSCLLHQYHHSFYFSFTNLTLIFNPLLLHCLYYR